MKIKQTLGFVGALILILGVFTPIMRVPLMGDLSYFDIGKGDGAILFALAVLSLVAVLLKKYVGLWFTGIGSFAVMLFTFTSFQSKMSQARALLGGQTFEGFADVGFPNVDVAQYFQMQWGWAFLALGAGLVIASAAIRGNR
jgi:hypothetical protein